MNKFTQKKWIATCLAWLVLLIFSALILTGWWYLLEPIVQLKGVPELAAIIITVLAVLCARQIGHYRADAARIQASQPWYLGWQFYIFLFVISALGILNAALTTFESRTILRDDISLVRHVFGELHTLAHKNLTPSDYKNKLAMIDGLLKKLHEEIVNPHGGNYCGVGPSATNIINEIKNIIPSYGVLNGSRHPIRPCHPNDPNAERVYSSYESMAHKMINSDQTFLAENGPMKLSFLTELDHHYSEMDADLTKLEAVAVGIGTTKDLDVQALHKSRDKYNADRQTYLSLSQSKSVDVPEITTLQSDQVNSYAATLGLILKRLNNPSTYFYLIIALLLDISLIYLITQLDYHFQFQKKGRQGSTFTIEDRFQTDPKFLWIEPPHNLRDN